MAGRAPKGERTRDAFRPEEKHELKFATRGGDVRRAVLEAMLRMNSAGEAAEEDYELALARVREHPGDAVAALVRAGWNSLPDEAYLDRWALMQLLVDLTIPAGVEVFEDVLSAPIPPERSSEVDYRYTTVGQEVVLRTTAVEGLRRQAAAGDERASSVLLHQVRHEHRSVRVAAVMALRELGGHDEEALREALSEEDRYALEIRRVEVRDVPQPTAVDYVRDPGRGGPVPPPTS